MTEIDTVTELTGKRIGELQEAVQDLRAENVRLWAALIRTGTTLALHLGVSQEEITSAYAEEISLLRKQQEEDSLHPQ